VLVQLRQLALLEHWERWLSYCPSRLPCLAPLPASACVPLGVRPLWLQDPNVKPLARDFVPFFKAIFEFVPFSKAITTVYMYNDNPTRVLVKY
jgi:hypothetical protein